MVAKWCLRYEPRVLLHAENLRHGTDNFTSHQKEGVLRFFYLVLYRAVLIVYNSV